MKRFRNTQYLISEEGMIYNENTKRFIKPTLKKFNKQGHRYFVGLYINNKQKNFLYHRLLAECFIPNPLNLPQINHIDGNGLNNNISNLEWCTAQYNNIHAIRTGLRPTKLNINKANEIRNLLKEGKTINELCVLYNVGRTIITKIRDNISWKI
jgi:HNH endonuclease/Helix-turn-helix domain of resolvase